jgi:hypothetical protein
MSATVAHPLRRRSRLAVVAAVALAVVILIVALRVVVSQAIQDHASAPRVVETGSEFLPGFTPWAIDDPSASLYGAIR